MFDTDKILCHPERIAQWLGGKPAPIHLGLCPTDLCPHDCPDCNGGRSIEKPATLTSDALKDIIKQFAQLGGKAVSMVGGGEPLMNPATLPALEYARWLGLSCGLISNGAVLGVGAEDRICAACDWVRVSWDAGSPEMYAKTHGPKADWNATIRNTERLIGVRKRRTKVGVSFLLGEKTVADALLAAKLADNTGADYIQFKSFDDDWFAPSKIIDSIREQMNGFPVIGLFRWEAPEARKYRRCHAMNFILEVAADGTMYPCCVSRQNRTHCLGNLLKKPMAEILESKAFQRMPVTGCPPYCRNHILNELIQAHYMDPPLHVDFV